MPGPKQKNILFISYDGMTDPLGQSQVIPYLKGLSKAGYSIFLLSCEKKEVFESNRQAIQQLLDADNIQWIPLSYTKKPPVASTMLDVFKLKKAAQKIHRDNKIDMVHTRPGIPALVGLWMKKKMGVKFLNDIREFYADSRVDGGMWNTRMLLYRTIYDYFKKKETEAVRLNDGIVCLTYAAENIIKEWKEYNSSIPMEVIPCSVDMKLFNPATINEIEKSKLKAELDIKENDLVISYLGSIGGWYLTDEMMQFCKILICKIPSVKLLFISPHRHNEIKLLAEKYEIPAAKVIIKKANRLQVPLLLSVSWYSVFFIKPCYSKQSSSPTKHGEIMAMGIPLITNSGVGDVEMIVEKFQSGVVLKGFTDQDYSKAVEEIQSGDITNSAKIRQAAKEFYSLETAIEKYIRIYKRILQ
ncbi:MAG: glycosyltransferase [Ferruginibacter sp.]|nr:glycosyltransferase [Ferruginibacter sp.]